MRVVATTTDPVRLSFLRALLADAGIDSIVLDAHISAMEGGIGAFPRPSEKSQFLRPCASARSSRLGRSNRSSRRSTWP